MKSALLIFLALAVGAQSQTPSPTGTPSSTPISRLSIWRCELPGGTYEVALRAIVSVSIHDYIVDGVARVNEVNVDTEGNMAARFYYLEPTAAKSPLGVGQSAIDRISDLAREAGQRVGADEVWRRGSLIIFGSNANPPGDNVQRFLRRTQSNATSGQVTSVSGAPDDLKVELSH